jgi:hypothetical protein
MIAFFLKHVGLAAEQLVFVAFAESSPPNAFGQRAVDRIHDRIPA